MDWGRAKTILILSFLSLNLILGYQLWVSRADLGDSTAGLTGSAEELDKLLQAKEIRILGEIPRDMPRLRGFTVQFDESFRYDEAIDLQEPFLWEAVPSRNPGRENFLKQYIEKVDAYQADPITSSNGVHSFYQMFGQYPIFNIRLELIEEQGKITSYRKLYVEVLPSEESKDSVEQRVISAQTAVQSLAENYLSPGTTILDIRLGYHGQLYNSPTQFMLPSWRIVTDKGEIYYFNALNGTVDIPQGEQQQIEPKEQ